MTSRARSREGCLLHNLRYNLCYNLCYLVHISLFQMMAVTSTLHSSLAPTIELALTPALALTLSLIIDHNLTSPRQVCVHALQGLYPRELVIGKLS